MHVRRVLCTFCAPFRPAGSRDRCLPLATTSTLGPEYSPAVSLVGRSQHHLAATYPIGYAPILEATLIEHVRQEAGLSQEELAKRAGTSRPTLSAYERGRKSPTLATVQRLLDSTGFELTAGRKVSFREVRTNPRTTCLGRRPTLAPSDQGSIRGGVTPPRAELISSGRVVSTSRSTRTSTLLRDRAPRGNTE